jgi:GNAT superfamily N-acetyltransferase
MSWTVSTIQLCETEAIGTLNELAFAEDEFRRMILPSRLKNPDITDADRARDTGDMIRSEIQGQGDRCIAHKVTTSDGQTVGFAMWKGPLPRPLSGARPEEPNQHQSSSALKAERDMAASKRFHDVYVPMEKKFVPGPHWWGCWLSLSGCCGADHRECRELVRLCTRPGFERQGVASTLLQSGLLQIDKRNPGLPTLICATPKGRSLYAKFGFVSVADEVQEEEQNEYGEAVPTRYPWSLMVRRLGQTEV